jgi:hypothetical protein
MSGSTVFASNADLVPPGWTIRARTPWWLGEAAAPLAQPVGRQVGTQVAKVDVFTPGTASPAGEVGVGQVEPGDLHGTHDVGSRPDRR